MLDGILSSERLTHTADVRLVHVTPVALMQPLPYWNQCYNPLIMVSSAQLLVRTFKCVLHAHVQLHQMPTGSLALTLKGVIVRMP